MNEENTTYLKERFEFLRTETNSGGRKVSLGLFGFECGDGWFYLIRDLCIKLQLLEIPDFHVHQVKEKFGGLRFYTGSIPTVTMTEIVCRYISQTENQSMEICEECGMSGTRHSRRGWIKTVCNGCATKWLSKK